MLLGQTWTHAAPVEVFTFCVRGCVAKGLEGAGGPLVVVLHMRGGLEGLLGTLVAEAIGTPIGVTPKERGAVVVCCLLHLWYSPKRFFRLPGS